jgi:predicted ABC-class ATPase
VRHLAIEPAKAIEALKRLEEAIEAQKDAVAHLTKVITKTEASRERLHDAGIQCWIDKLDSESGHG